MYMSRQKPNHTCLPTFQLIHNCPGCAFELGEQLATKTPTESAKYVWMVVGSDNPCDIRRYSFSHAQGVAQLAHAKKRERKGRYKDYTGGTWRLFKLVPVNREEV
jgi:hypothetical protein